MSNVISGNMVGGGSAPLKTVILEDENGNEVFGIVTENLQVFDATPADVKIGKTFASSDGILEGTDTKTYRTTQGSYAIRPRQSFSVPLSQYDQYNYTKFQALIAEFNTNSIDSIYVDKISLYDAVYGVNSNDKLSYVTKNSSTKSIDLNITNNTEKVYMIHYMTYKEE